jgi:hypothetical protein
MRIKNVKGTNTLRNCWIFFFVWRSLTINAEYYSSLLVQLNNIFKEKRRALEGHQRALVLA